MQIEFLKTIIFYHGCKIAKIDSKVHSKGESEDSQRSFRFKRARKVDQRALSKIFEKL